MSWIGWIGEWVYGALAAASATLEEWGETLYCVGISIWCWLMNFLVDALDEWFVSPIVGAMPEPPSNWDFTFVAGLYGTVNRYVPLSEGAAMLGIYATFYLGIVCLRFVKSFIPGLS